MSHPPDLRLLLATDLSDAPASAQRAVAQLSESCRVDLTVAHVAASSSHLVTAALDAWPRPSGEYRRVVLAGDDPAAAVAALCDEHSYDFVMAPAARSRGWWAPFRRSFRARLVVQSAVPVWTAGGGLGAMNFARPVRTVACLVDFAETPSDLVQMAARYARRLGARLHVLAVLPPIDDGTLAEVLTADAPLLPEPAARRIHELCAGQTPPAIDIVVGSAAAGLRRMVQRCTPDVLFVPARPWSSLTGRRIAPVLDGLPCPVICVPPAAMPFAGWSFERESWPLDDLRWAGRMAVPPGRGAHEWNEGLPDGVPARAL